MYLVSDGIETCEDEPIEAAKELYNFNITPIINVIGFDVDNEGQQQLKQLASEVNGIYGTVTSESELQKELEKLNNLAEQWGKWLKQGKQQYERNYIKNNLEIFVYITKEESKGVQEREKIYFILTKLHEEKVFNNETYEYLINKNSKYHKWIDNEIKNFNKELKAINEQNYKEALEQLEEKYVTNTQISR